MAKSEVLPAGIRKRGENYFVDVSYKGLRKTATCAELSRAITRQIELKEELFEQKEMECEDRWSLKEGYQHTLRTDWADSSSSKQITLAMNVALEFFGPDTMLDEIDTNFLDAYIELLKGKGNANSTINRKVCFISKIFTEAQKRNKVKHRPYFPRLKEPEGRVRFLSKDEEQEAIGLLTHWGHIDEMHLFSLLIDTGLRVKTEALAIRCKDVDFALNQISVWKTKNKLARTIPMTQRVRSFMEKRCAGLDANDKVFAFQYWWVRGWWTKLRRIMGNEEDPEFVPHALRHTCCSRLVMTGVPLNAVREWMGHKSLSVTMKYAHLAPKALHTAVARLEGGNIQ